ncbi:MAG: FAD binding domain-containing protein [bacterium]|nr:FAD binding domain-containing protein [bacterium]
MAAEFFIPETLEEAVSIKEKTAKSFYLGGGTILNLWTKKSSKNLISLHKLPLKGINRSNGFIEIGSMTTMTEMTQDPILKDNIPLAELLKSCYEVSKNTRNMATAGGIFGSRYTRSDFLPLFLVMDCDVISYTSGGEKRESAESYLANPPSKTGLITRIAIREKNEPFFIKTDRFARSSNDLPVIKTAVSFIPKGNSMNDIKIACGGLYDKPVRLYELEELLEGRDYSDGSIPELIRNRFAEMAPGRSDIRGPEDFKKALASSMIEDIIAGSGKEQKA